MQTTDAERIAAGKCDEELIGMFSRPQDWQPAVVQAVRLEIQRRQLPIPSDIAAADSARQQLDQAIDTLLKNTHHAWQSVEIPKVVFSSDRSLSLENFIAEYRSNRLELLTSFCTQFGPVLEGEFILTYASSAISRKPLFFLTSERLMVWDTRRLKYWIFPLDSCVSFSRKGWGPFLLETKDGNSSEIFGKCPFQPDQSTTTMIQATIAWFHAVHGSPDLAATSDINSDKGLEVQLPDGQVLKFSAAEALREPILRGEIPRTATVKVLAPAPAGKLSADKPAAPPKAQALASWAKSNEKLRPLYAPIWAMTLKGALWGTVVVGILKTVDSAVSFFQVSPTIALLWLWLGALIASPKWKRQILQVGGVVLIAVLTVEKYSINFGALFSLISRLFYAWFGVVVFAAVFGISAGMPVGTIVGAIRARRAQCAPDRQREGMKPVVWGILVPATVFIGSGILYLRVLMPYLIKTLSNS